MAENNIKLPTVSKEELNIRKYLESSPAITYYLNEHSGYLKLTPKPLPDHLHTEQACFICHYGLLFITNAEYLLCLISICPALSENMNTGKDDWYWELYNSNLSPEMKEIFGYLYPTKQKMPSMLSCAVEISINRQSAKGFISMPLLAWTKIFLHSNWEINRAIINSHFIYYLPLLLSSTTLPAGMIQSLRTGDILIPDNQFFSPNGLGRLKIGNKWIYLQQSTAEILTFLVIHNKVQDMESTQSDANYPEIVSISSEDVSEQRQFMVQDTDFPDLSGIPVTVTLRAGTLEITLEQLHSLGPGSILAFCGSTPGYATLYYAERPLAHGELVDIEGELGLRITRMERF
ncbi:hypothetical protein EHW66_08315 [Erwinia psidii]|uniref:FliM/FliN family flagellar motor switch protein n=1 Tax=Erwinia psidii TaxID=69224 RepID=UPI00226B6492|nr:FliM/FliN family flagellar motor switch protein [Erwinia psidii]MCX8965011.1 hypothetical protein [Erwinia psidii]